MYFYFITNVQPTRSPRATQGSGVLKEEIVWPVWLKGAVHDWEDNG